MVGLALLIVSLQLGASLVQQRQDLRSKASGPTVSNVPETSFSIQPVDSAGSPATNYSLGQEIHMKLLVRADIDSANLFVAKLKFPADKLQVSRIETTASATFVKNWVENVHDNQTGTISLVGGVPSPGYQTQVGQASSLMADIVFTAKQTGTAIVTFDQGAAIYRNLDNTNILAVKRDGNVNISASTATSSQPQTFGFNIRGITHYGHGDILPYSKSSDIDADLAEIQRMGGTVVRVFVANKNISDETAAKRLDAFLTKAASYNISVIPTLIDFYHSGFNPAATERYYTLSYSSTALLNGDFFASGYKDSYLPFVETVVSYNKSHGNIYAWEPGNELKNDSSPQNFINFMKDVTSTIKTLDPAHQIATGMINSGHAGLSPAQLYPNLPAIDIITIHSYNGDHNGSADADWAAANNKKTILEEVGFSGTGDRSLQMKSELGFWQSKKVSLPLQWGFLAKGLTDNGDGDKEVGMDTIWHMDYDNLATVFKGVVSSSNITPAISNITPTAVPRPSLSPTPVLVKGDGNGDGKVNLIDMSVLLSSFNNPSLVHPQIDFNNDGVINTFDFSAMIKALISSGVVKGSQY